MTDKRAGSSNLNSNIAQVCKLGLVWVGFEVMSHLILGPMSIEFCSWVIVMQG